MEVWHRRYLQDRHQTSQLHRIGRIDSHLCPLCQEVESGDHVTFECPGRSEIRKAWILGKTTWVELDSPDWSTEEEGQDKSDRVEVIFEFMYLSFQGR